MLRITIAKGIEKDDIDSYGEHTSSFAVILAENDKNGNLVHFLDIFKH